MLPLISFDPGRKTQTQSSGQLEGLRQQMEVWFFYQEGTTAERPTHAAKNQKEFTPALLRSASGELLPLDKDLSWKSLKRFSKSPPFRGLGTVGSLLG